LLACLELMQLEPRGSSLSIFLQPSFKTVFWAVILTCLSATHIYPFWCTSSQLGQWEQNRRCYDATVPHTYPCTDSLRRLGGFNHLDQMVLCHHNPHHKAIIEPSLQPQSRLHQESRCQTLCTLQYLVMPTLPETSPAYGTREQRTKKGIYRPLGPGLGTFEPVKRDNSRQIRQTRYRIYRKSVHASVFFRYQT
jgi:hypothetical protein